MKNNVSKLITTNFSLKLLSILFAIFLWVIVVSIDDPVTTKIYRGIPVAVANEDIVTNNGKTYQIEDDTQTVTVTVKARRSILSKIGSSSIVATADMKEMELASLVPIAISITGYEGQYEEATANPINMQVRIEDTSSNKFPITVATTGTLRDGYAMGDLTTNPETVTISGPESLVNSINKVVARVDVSGLSESTSVPADLQIYNSDDSMIDQTLLRNNLGDAGVTVKINLLQTKSIGLSFDTSAIRVREGYSFTGITYEPQTIHVAGDEKIISGLDTLEIPRDALEIDDLTKKTEAVVELKDRLPDGVELVDEEAGTVAVTINVEQSGTRSFDVPTGSIVVNNASKNLKVDYGDVSDVELQIQGPQETLDNLSVDHKVYVDLSNFQTAGTHDVPVAIDLPDGCSLVQPVTVRMTLEKQ